MSTKRKATWIAPSFDDFGTAEKGKKTNKEKKIINVETETDPLEESTNSWVDKYKPQTEDELAVHKKKLLEIKTWLKQHLIQTKTNRVGILLLTGPSGCGKTACIHALQKELGYDLVEWINPLMQEFDRDNLRDATARQESQSQLFHDFLLRANRYQQLRVDDEPSVTSHCGDKRVILIEDMPNFLLYDATKMHAILRQYKQKGKSPLVFIMSDSNLDNFIHSLFPKKLQNEIDITNISLNPIAQTSLIKTMTKIASSEAEQYSNLTVPSKDVLDMLATSSNGDIRACINSLQFYCTDSRNTTAQKSTNTKSKKTSRKKIVKSGKLDDIVGCIGSKDTSLFLFRALGKILYCKREKDFDKVEDTLPIHFHKEKRKKLVENPEDVFGHTQVTSEKFLMYLHQNYAEFFASIDDLATAASYCVDSDVMSGIWDNRHTMNDYTASLCMRGIMFSNTRPSSSGGPGGGWRPLHKPHWFDAFKLLNQRTKNGRQFVKGCNSTNTVFTELLPYLNAISPNNALVSEISSFPLNKQHQIRQSMKVLNNANYEDNSEAFDPLEHYVAMTTTNENYIMVEQFDELDDIIEDFDDD